MSKKKEEGGWESSRVIALISGDSGCGKSFFVANLKKAIIYDTDIGGGLAYADKRIEANKSLRVEISSYKDLLEDLRTRAKSGSLAPFVTIVIDHVTGLQQEGSTRHNPNLTPDFGRSNDAATREWRKIREFMRIMDFNLIVTAHLKAKYENDKMVGQISDGPKNIEADFGIVVYLMRKGMSYPSAAKVQKWRRDPSDPRGEVPWTFDFTVDQFEAIAGSAMGRERVAITPATEAQVKELKELLSVVKLEEGRFEKWLEKAGAETVEELTAERANEALKLLKDRLPKSATSAA